MHGVAKPSGILEPEKRSSVISASSIEKFNIGLEAPRMAGINVVVYVSQGKMHLYLILMDELMAAYSGQLPP